uniref:DNA mismatch repair protein Msh3 n=1 Tax=Anthurium amnicola TaxID=1678845 RepID=A0A1D1XR39_9ARAE
MGASDSIQQGRSTFLEELSEASHILHCCSSHSLVIIDELGRGTSTHDGFAIAYATLQYLLKQKKCIVLFVTHYPKMKDIQYEFIKAVRTYHVSYLTSENAVENIISDSSASEWDQFDITFLYKVIPGASDKSFGLNVARLAQLPSSCINRAAAMAAKLELYLNKRVDNQFERNMLKLSEREGNDSLDPLNASGILFGDEEDIRRLTNEFHRLFLHLQSASSDVSYLWVAKELALQLLSATKLESVQN